MPERPLSPWAFRSALIAVTDLDRSVAFYREIGPFEEFARDDAVAVLGETSPPSVVLMLRAARSIHEARHGQQSLGLRAVTFNVGSPAELDRVESVLRHDQLFTGRRSIDGGVAQMVLGRDPDNLPLAFISFADGATPDAEYYRTVAELIYSLDT